MSGRRVLIAAVVAAFLVLLGAPEAMAIDSDPISEDPGQTFGEGPGEDDGGPDNPIVDRAMQSKGLPELRTEVPRVRVEPRWSWFAFIFKVFMLTRTSRFF